MDEIPVPGILHILSQTCLLYTLKSCSPEWMMLLGSCRWKLWCHLDWDWLISVAHLVGRLCFLSAWLLSVIFPVGHLSRTKILYLGHIQLKLTLWKVKFYFLFCSMLARLIEQLRVHKSKSEMFCLNKYNDSLSSEMRFRNLGEEILD